MYQKSVMHVRSCVCFLSLLDRDGNENVKKAIGLDKLKKQQQQLCARITLFCTFLCRHCRTTM